MSPPHKRKAPSASGPKNYSFAGLAGDGLTIGTFSSGVPGGGSAYAISGSGVHIQTNGVSVNAFGRGRGGGGSGVTVIHNGNGIATLVGTDSADADVVIGSGGTTSNAKRARIEREPDAAGGADTDGIRVAPVGSTDEPTAAASTTTTTTTTTEAATAATVKAAAQSTQRPVYHVHVASGDRVSLRFDHECDVVVEGSATSVTAVNSSITVLNNATHVTATGCTTTIGGAVTHFTNTGGKAVFNGDASPRAVSIGTVSNGAIGIMRAGTVVTYR